MRYFELCETTLQDVGYHVDNPGGRWLANKQKEVGAKHGRGSITATIGLMKRAEIRVAHVQDLRGASGEHEYRHKSAKLQDLRDRVDAEGWKPESPIMIWVNQFGDAVIGEGNHRVQLAKEMGIEWIPVDIRYWAGGEDSPGDFHPSYLIQRGLVRPRSR